jgi:hypothetical protein
MLTALQLGAGGVPASADRVGDGHGRVAFERILSADGFPGEGVGGAR